MKNLIIIIGTIVLGVFIVTNFVLGDNSSSLKTASEKIMKEGTDSISQSVDFKLPSIGQSIGQ